MEQEARLYQDQLHQANQERMKRFEDKLDRTLEAMIQIAEAIKCIPQIDARVESLEAERDQRKGAMVVISFISGLIGAGVAAVIRHFWK